MNSRRCVVSTQLKKARQIKNLEVPFRFNRNGKGSSGCWFRAISQDLPSALHLIVPFRQALSRARLFVCWFSSPSAGAGRRWAWFGSWGHTSLRHSQRQLRHVSPVRTVRAVFSADGTANSWMAVGGECVAGVPADRRNASQKRIPAPPMPGIWKSLVLHHPLRLCRLESALTPQAMAALSRGTP